VDNIHTTSSSVLKLVSGVWYSQQSPDIAGKWLKLLIFNLKDQAIVLNRYFKRLLCTYFRLWECTINAT